MQKSRLKEKTLGLPDSPGVYIMKDSRGRVIYVGKAKSLRSRLRNYFAHGDTLDRKTQVLMESAADLDHINVGSEVEALLLESNLIKEHRPRYNVTLKDDKRYPFIKVTLQEPFPRVLVTRRVLKDGAKYFGPYTASRKMRATLKALRAIFPIRACSYKLPEQRPERECLDYHLGRCLCPCLGHQSEEDYMSMIEEVLLFLSGRQDEVKKLIRRKMEEEARAMRFESAALLRDRLEAIEAISQKQRVLSTARVSYDAVSLARDGNLACGVILNVREGKLLGIEHHFLGNVRDHADGALLSLFMARYYLRERDFQGDLLLPFDFEDLDLIRKWLESHGASSIKVLTPKRGEKKKVMELAHRNAELFLADLKAQTEKEHAPPDRALLELKEFLSLSEPPALIACFDVSNLGESFAVGSVVVFQGEKPERSRYRKFRIRTVEGQNDFAMMREIVTRFLRRCREGEEMRPDLILIDGGKGQLSAALDALKESGLDIPVAALAKEKEELFVPGSPVGRILPESSPALSLLVQIRNEAHRFAVSYHRNSRSRALVTSLLDEVTGIGPKRRKRLLEIFTTIDELAAAEPEEIAKKGHIPLDTAVKLTEFLRGMRAREN
jgi:excinuclease ABC subunit C